MYLCLHQEIARMLALQQVTQVLLNMILLSWSLDITFLPHPTVHPVAACALFGTTLEVLNIPTSNGARLATQKGYIYPDTEETRCPRLDSIVKQNLSKDIRDADTSAAKLQALTLDATAPPVHSQCTA